MFVLTDFASFQLLDVLHTGLRLYAAEAFDDSIGVIVSVSTDNKPMNNFRVNVIIVPFPIPG